MECHLAVSPTSNSMNGSYLGKLRKEHEPCRFELSYQLTLVGSVAYSVEGEHSVDSVTSTPLGKFSSVGLNVALIRKVRSRGHQGYRLSHRLLSQSLLSDSLLGTVQGLRHSFDSLHITSLKLEGQRLHLS